MEDEGIIINRQIYDGVRSEYARRKKWLFPVLFIFLILSVGLFVLNLVLLGFMPLLAGLFLLRSSLRKENPRIAVVTGIVNDKRESPNEQPNYRLELLLEKVELIDKSGYARPFKNYAALHDIGVDRKLYERYTSGQKVCFIFLPGFILAGCFENGRLVKTIQPIDQNKTDIAFL